jgi:hypothetical protein
MGTHWEQGNHQCTMGGWIVGGKEMLFHWFLDPLLTRNIISDSVFTSFLLTTQ